MGQKQLSDGRYQVDIRDANHTRLVRIFKTREEAMVFLVHILETRPRNAPRYGKMKTDSIADQGTVSRVTRH
jgi:hypothetical protein